MHGPPEAEGAKTQIEHLFEEPNPLAAARLKYAPDGPEPCDHPWGVVQYPAYQWCARCARVLLIHDPISFPED